MTQKLNYFQTRPKVSAIDVNGYLERLELELKAPTLHFLKQLHRRHLEKIPFENLDLHYNRKIVPDISKIYEKVIHRKRGGGSYELNALFYHLLAHLGYDCWLAAARIKEEEGWGPEFGHIIVIVALEHECWLADVGFGQLFSEPKKLVVNMPQLDYTRYFRFEHDPDEYFILKESDNNIIYSPRYIFSSQPKELIQFIEMCAAPREPGGFHGKFITQLFPEGRITLTDRQLKLELNGETEELPIMNEDEFLAKLEHHFGINLKAIIHGPKS